MDTGKIKTLASAIEGLDKFKFYADDASVRFEGGKLYSASCTAEYLAMRLNNAIKKIKLEVEEELRAQLVICGKTK